MGQTLGCAPVSVGCKRFINLPRCCIYGLWEAFNDIAEGFGLTIEEFEEIIKSALMTQLNTTEKALISDAANVFKIFDDDDNNLVDSLEFLSAFALLSGMTPEEKIRFTFALYDFDESSVLTLDEMVLAFRSTLSGLTKLSNVDPPSEAEIETIAVHGYERLRMNNRSLSKDADFDGIDVEVFVRYCLNTPEIISWIEYYDDIDEAFKDSPREQHTDTVTQTNTDRSLCQEAVMSPAIGGLTRLETERRGLAKDILPKQSWQNVLPFLTPSRQPTQSDYFPAQSFTMEWVYGFNAHTSCHNLFYTANGAIIYPAGAVCIVMDIGQRTQTFFTMHTDLITCLKVLHTCDGRTIAASGEVGRRPAVHIWEADSKTLLCTLQGYHRGGILHIDLSPDHSKIVVMGMDKYHCITVDNWVTKQRIWAGRSTPEHTHDLRFLSPTLIGAVGKGHFAFFAEKIGATLKYAKHRGVFGSSVVPENLWCVAAMGDLVVTGSASGRLLVWEGRNLIDSVKSHSSPILCCHAVNKNDKNSENGLVTGCSGGKVVVWSAKLEVCAVFNVNSLGSVEPALSCVCWDQATSKILVGFRSCEIFEIDSFAGRNLHTSAIVSSHFSPNVTGIALHPMNPRLVCTVSDDKTVRVFDAELHKQVRSVKLDTVGTCCAYSSDGQLILVGYGSNREGGDERKEGAYVVLSEEDLSIVCEARDSKSPLTACRFSPNGELYALTSSDGSIYVYKKSGYAIKVICRGHAGSASHIDFSQDSRFLMTNSTAGEVLFWDISSGDILAPKIVRDMKWATNTCVYSYGTQGFWGAYDDGVQCFSACRSHSRDLMAVVDSCGRLRVSTAPCVKPDPPVAVLLGHASDARACEFSCDDSHLFSIGSRDGTLIQWISSLDGTSSFPDASKGDLVSDDLAAEIRFHGKVLERSRHAENVLNDIPSALCTLEEAAESTLRLQPWQRTIVAPSLAPPEDPSEPSDSLALEFIYGFSVENTRHSLIYSAQGELIFFAGSVVVLMNQRKRTQRFYSHHQASICAIAATSEESGSLVASSDVMEAPTIRIWNSITLETLAVLQGFHRRGVCHLKFSTDGSRLASVGMDRLQSWAVYSWRNNQILSTSQSFPNRSLCMDFTPNGEELLQCGNGVIRFWKMRGKIVTFQDAILGTRAKVQAFLCVGWIGNNAVVGTDDGCLYRFVSKKLDGLVPAHKGSVTALASCSDGICSGSSDGFLKVWTRIMDCKISIDLKTFPLTSTNLRCLSWMNNTIALGTSHGEIIEVDACSGENAHLGVLLTGHGGEELWGLAVNPVKDMFCTVGEDAYLRLWNVETHQAVASFQLEMGARCCSYSPDGARIAVGLGSPRQTTNKHYDGKWIILDAEDFETLHEARDCTSWLSDAKYSPNGELLAFGSALGTILVYSVLDNYSLSATINQHHAVITSLDFSEDSKWMRSTCSAFELYFYEADTGMHVPAASRLRDTVWGTQNCPLGWAVQGIWPPQVDGTECTACDSNIFRGRDGAVIVAGDIYGGIQLFRSPCVSAFAASKRYRVSPNPLMRLRFCAGDSRLLSISGADKVIAQWTHKRDRGEEVAWNVISRRESAMGGRAEEDGDVARLLALTTGGPDDYGDVGTDIMTTTTSRPWLAAVMPPSKMGGLHIDPSMPNERLEKHHIFGLESSLSRGSVRFNRDGDYLYPTSKYVCVFNKKKNTQILYEGHCLRNPSIGANLEGLSASTAPDGLPITTSDSSVCCVCTSADGRLVASAAECDRPNIHVWDASGCVTVCVLQLLHRKGVVSMQFSSNRKFLVSAGSDSDHSIALWESPSTSWTDGRLLACCKGDPLPVMFCSFYSSESAPQDYLLVSGGKFHIKFWNLNGRCLNSSYPEYSTKEHLGTLLCGVASAAQFISGSTTGCIFVWMGRRLVQTVRAHDTPVTCLWSDPAVGAMSAAKDSVVKLWTSAMKHVRSFSLGDADVPPIAGGVRSLDAVILEEPTPRGIESSIQRILVSTDTGEIYEIAGKSGSATLIHEAHYTGQLYGLCVHPTQAELFATCGDDNTVRVWSITHRRLLRKAVLDCTARSICWSGDGRHLLVGMGGTMQKKRQKKDGAWLMLNADTLKPEFEGRDSRHWLQSVKFSPDGQSFACSSADHKIYLYHRDTFQLKGTCDKHKGPIRNFDYSADSVFIQSDSADAEHLFFEADDGKHFPQGSQLCDVAWADWTCTLGWPVQGIWPKTPTPSSGYGGKQDEDGGTSGGEGSARARDKEREDRGMKPCAAHRSADHRLLAVGDEEGTIKLYHYPCISKEAIFKHGKVVLAFSYDRDNKHMFSPDAPHTQCLLLGTEENYLTANINLSSLFR